MPGGELRRRGNVEATIRSPSRTHASTNGIRLHSLYPGDVAESLSVRIASSISLCARFSTKGCAVMRKTRFVVMRDIESGPASLLPKMLSGMDL